MNGIRFALSTILVGVCLIGCRGQRPEEPKAGNQQPDQVAIVPSEWWDIYLLQNRRVGYGSTKVSAQQQGGRQLVCTESYNRLIVKRESDITVQEIRTSSLETLDRELVSFECEMQMGMKPMRTVAKVIGNQLEMLISGGGAVGQRRINIPWQKNYRGPFAVEQTLISRPMQPGEKREFTMLMAGFNQTAHVKIVAKDWEDVELLDGKRKLLRVETTSVFSNGDAIECTLWVNRRGAVLKTSSPAMGLMTYRVSKEKALEHSEAADLDLLAESLIHVAHPLTNAHRTKRVRYRVWLDGDDPARIFVNDISQSVRSLDSHTAEIVVFAVRPDEKNVNPNAPDDPVLEEYRQANSFINSDDPEIIAEARKVAGNETDPWQIALALEKFVHKEIKNKNFSQAFATASEVAKSREGDCTEHAVYLAALCRACGIPARVAIGLVYIQSRNAFGYHLWTEANIKGRWIPIDGTLAYGGIGAAHLKLSTSSLKDASAYSAFLPVIKILGRLKIDVIEVDDDGTTIIPGDGSPLPLWNIKRREFALFHNR